ncbi:MAG: rhomboid family intramembrane serine protease [Planctomycetota bacterium]|jgi:membrane associated rhomboid family serine protease
MGIYDRHYLRREPPTGGGYGRGGLQAVGMWSVNTWLILICVAVFMIDGFTPARWVQVREPYVFATVEGVPKTAVAAGPVAHVRGPLKDFRGEVKVREFDARALLERPVTRSNPEPNQIGWVAVMRMPWLQSFLHFSTARGFLKLEVWRFVGFQFLHAHLPHLLFNVIGLYFFGPLVERKLGSKRYLAFYLLCGIFGAVMFLLLNLGGHVTQLATDSDVAIPGFIFDSPYTPLIGASAGVFGVLMAGAKLVPDAKVLLFFILPMRLVTLAYAIVAIALFTVIIGGDNAGGQAAHLGGAIAGYYFIRRPEHLHGFFDFLGWADPTSHHYRDKGPRPAGGRPPADRAEVDRILDKISTSGLHSLSEKEKRILREASNR